MKNRSILLRQLVGAFLIILAGIFFANAAHASGNAKEKDSDVNICYIQFYLNTFVPLTSENISHHSDCYRIAANSNAAVALIGLLNDAKPISGGSEKFNDNIVRVMLSESSSQEPYFVDQNGVVSRGKSIAKLSTWQKDAVQIILNSS